MACRFRHRPPIPLLSKAHTPAGLLYREVNADNTFVEYRYDLDGGVSEVQDALLKTTIYQRDALDRVTRVQQQNGEGAIVTYYGYDTRELGTPLKYDS